MPQLPPYFSLRAKARPSAGAAPRPILAARLSLVLAVFLLLCCPPPRLAAEAAPPSPPDESITVVLDDHYPPYIMRDEGGTLKGILVDQWRLWEEKTGVRAKIHAMDWAEAQRRLLAGEFDVIDTLFRTENREKQYEFSKPYASIEVPLFFHEDLSGIEDVQDAHGFLVGVKEGDAVIEFLHEKGIRSLAEFRSYEQLLAAAGEGRVKVFSVDRPPALYFLNKMGISDRFRETKPLYSGEFHRAVRKGNAALLARVEEGFARISPEEYRRIERRWLGSPLALPWPSRQIKAVATAIAGLVLLLLLWVWFLRRGIAKHTAALRRSGEYLQAVFDSVNDAIFVHDGASGAIIDVNQRMCAMYGMSREKALGASVEDLSLGEAPYSQREAFAWLERARREGPQIFEWRARRGDGEVFPVEVSIRTGRVGGEDRFFVTVRDISARKQAEEALRASEEKYRRLHESMMEAFVAVDMNGRIVESNRVFQEMLGYAALELGQLSYVDLTPEKWHAMEAAIVAEQIMPHGFSEVYEKEYRRKDGSIFPVELRTFLLRDAQGRPERMWAIVRNLTERKKAEEHRREMERRLLYAQKLESLGVMAGGIAHDFNNLLMAVLGNLDLALLDLPPSSRARDNILQSMQAARRAADLTRQMLAYSGRGHFIVQPLDLNELVRENLHLFRAGMAKAAQLVLHPADHLPLIAADAGQVQQIVMNLITNASEALEGKAGIVSIETGEGYFDEQYLASGRQQKTPPPGHYAWVEVADAGCGMDPATLQRLFDPFFTTKFTGRGLGMSALLGIIHGHEGAIMVRSEKGGGTTIRVLFPALAEKAAMPEAREAAAAPVDETPAPSAGERGTVLLVDDEELVRQVCGVMLGRLGWEVLEAEDGARAVEIFRERAATISLTIMDLSMPRMNGMEAFREIRRIDPRAIVLLASGFNADDDLRAYADQGVAGFLGKPFNVEHLRGIIDDVLAKG